MMCLDTITSRHHMTKLRYAEEKSCSLGYGERGIVIEEPGLLRGVIALACSGAIGSLLVYGYQKWIKKR
jgi:hypothetical protein